MRTALLALLMAAMFAGDLPLHAEDSPVPRRNIQLDARWWMKAMDGPTEAAATSAIMSYLRKRADVMQHPGAISRAMLEYAETGIVLSRTEAAATYFVRLADASMDEIRKEAEGAGGAPADGGSSDEK